MKKRIVTDVWAVIRDEFDSHGFENPEEIASIIVDKFRPKRETHFGRVQGDTLWFDFPGKLQMFPESRTYTRESLTITTGWEEKE